MVCVWFARGSHGRVCFTCQKQKGCANAAHRRRRRGGAGTRPGMPGAPECLRVRQIRIAPRCRSRRRRLRLCVAPGGGCACGAHQAARAGSQAPRRRWHAAEDARSACGCAASALLRGAGAVAAGFASASNRAEGAHAALVRRRARDRRRRGGAGMRPEMPGGRSAAAPAGAPHPHCFAAPEPSPPDSPLRRAGLRVRTRRASGGVAPCGSARRGRPRRFAPWPRFAASGRCGRRADGPVIPSQAGRGHIRIALRRRSRRRLRLCVAPG